MTNSALVVKGQICRLAQFSWRQLTTLCGCHTTDGEIWGLGMDEFDAIAAELLAAQRYEHEEQARELLVAADEMFAFSDLLRRIPAGEVIGLTLIDGSTLRGRIVRVGRDWLRLSEVADELGTARARARRVHEIRLAGVSRVSRESR
jgi:hypothetical protein